MIVAVARADAQSAIQYVRKPCGILGTAARTTVLVESARFFLLTGRSVFVWYLEEGRF